MKKSVWQYQKNRYKQINLKFFKESETDMEIFKHLKTRENVSRYLKVLIYEDMQRWCDKCKQD